MSDNRRIVITGGLGYLGSVLAPYLAERGFQPCVMDIGFFENCLLTPPAEVEVRRQDARDLTRKDLENVAAVVHLAGISNDPVGGLSAAKVYDPTRECAKSIATLCKELGIRFIFASSCSIYGKAEDAFLTETSKVNPQTPYSVNKLQIEQDLTELSDRTFAPICLRFATVYGMSPRIRFDLYINMMAGMALTRGEIVLNSNGQAWRPNLHIRDLCKSVHYSLNTPEPSERPLVLNVGDSRDNYQILQVATMIRDSVPGCQIKFLQNDPANGAKMELVRDRKIQDGVDSRTYRVSFEKIKAALQGFECEWRVATGIRNLVDSLRSAGLKESQFGSIDFYRLQKIEDYFKRGMVTDDLRWNLH